MDIIFSVVFFIIIIFALGVKILRPVEVGIIEFLGRYSKTASAGFNWIIPFLSKMYRI
ncbi:MAG: SPFH/Band 7/PHB domain protein, partial [Anaerolineae bacterium]|nr:SPFH/Band 7/PHB domain protein [Anaerolineae bacterium]